MHIIFGSQFKNYDKQIFFLFASKLGLLVSYTAMLTKELICILNVYDFWDN
jgi:hypothetical protein